MPLELGWTVTGVVVLAHTFLSLPQSQLADATQDGAPTPTGQTAQHG
jgi:hypothetical protein